MQSTLLDQGTDLLVYGMGTVFVFLTLLVICVTIMSKVIDKFFGVEDEAFALPSGKDSVTVKNHAIDPELLEVIQDAIYQHRAKN